MLPVTDMWLPDYKADDDALHVKYIGVSNFDYARSKYLALGMPDTMPKK